MDIEKEIIKQIEEKEAKFQFARNIFEINASIFASLSCKVMDLSCKNSLILYLKSKSEFEKLIFQSINRLEKIVEKAEHKNLPLEITKNFVKFLQEKKEEIVDKRWWKEKILITLVIENSNDHHEFLEFYNLGWEYTVDWKTLEKELADIF